jgi:N-acylneuraminate cytidylyltransferase
MTRRPSDEPTAVALVPARSGSERVQGKNVLPLAGHPLLAYTVAAAGQSGVFDAIVVSTDSAEIAEVARRYGAEVPGLRPPELATSTSPDIEWVLHVTRRLGADGRSWDAFSLLRPTSPFRTAATIRRAWARFLELGDRIDSLRAVELCSQHPGKMWVLEGDLMRPLLPQPASGTPYHSSQYQSLPPVYVQNSSLEIAWTRILDEREIAGSRVAPFFTEGAEGFSVDYPGDVETAERWVAEGIAELPPIEAVVA